MESLFLYLQQFTKIVLDYTKHCNLSFRKIKWQITGFGPLSIRRNNISHEVYNQIFKIAVNF